MPRKKQLWGRLYGITPQNKVGCLFVYRRGKTWILSGGAEHGQVWEHTVHPASTYFSEAGLILGYSELVELLGESIDPDREREVMEYLEKKAAERAAKGQT